MIESYRQELENFKISVTEDYSFVDKAGNVSEISNWNINGLPSNEISVCNGILVKRAVSYPYMIDPQLQANSWIRKQEDEDGLRIIKASDLSNMEKTIETCIRLNVPCLIEDATEEIPAFLD